MESTWGDLGTWTQVLLNRQGGHKLWSLCGDSRDQGNLIKGAMPWPKKEKVSTDWDLLGEGKVMADPLSFSLNQCIMAPGICKNAHVKLQPAFTGMTG